MRGCLDIRTNYPGVNDLAFYLCSPSVTGYLPCCSAECLSAADRFLKIVFSIFDKKSLVYYECLLTFDLKGIKTLGSSKINLPVPPNMAENG